MLSGHLAGHKQMICRLLYSYDIVRPVYLPRTVRPPSTPVSASRTGQEVDLLYYNSRAVPIIDTYFRKYLGMGH